MRLGILLFAFLLLNQLSFAQHELPIISEEALTIGQTLTIESAVLEEERVLNVYLPLSYSTDSLKNYPVIYLLDGSLDEDFIHIAGLVQFGSFEWIDIVPESIVVGISNVDRQRDFTYPSQNERDLEELPTSGGSANFISFIEEELQPLIHAKYRTTSSSTIIGQSLGGLLATQILFEKPDLFDHYIIVSPSLWWDDESLLQQEPTAYTSEKSIFIANGKEGEQMERTGRALFDKLDEQKGSNVHLYYGYFTEQDHGDVLHLAVYQAFEEVFGGEEE
jgi:hypothetical protein